MMKLSRVFFQSITRNVEKLELCHDNNCTKCAGDEHSLLLSIFPLLIHCVIEGVNMVNTCDRLRYLSHVKVTIISFSWSSAICNLEQLYIESDQLALLDSDMNA